MYTYPWQIFGHKNLLDNLNQDLVSKSVNHVTLITGPANTGKFTILKRLAQFLQSEDEESFDCKVSKQIAQESHIDTLIYTKDGKALGIKEFRELKEVLYLTPQSKYKIVIIQDIERLSHPLLNAMLKILEEPPSKVLFFLSSSNIEEVPETILSRSRILRTGTATDREVKEFLISQFETLDEEFLEEVVLFSAGKMGRAYSLVQNSDQHQHMVNWLSQIRYLNNNANEFEILKFAEEISELERLEILNFLELMMQFYRREMLVSKEKDKKALISIKVQKIMETIDLIKKNVNIKIALEVLFLHSFGTLGIMENH